jgi:transposase
VTNNPDKTLAEIIEEPALPIHKSRLSFLLIKAGFSLKKTTYPAAQDREDIQKERRNFAETIKTIDVSMKGVKTSDLNANLSCQHFA